MKKFKLLKLYLVCLCMLISCAACGSSNENETTPINVETSADKNTISAENQSTLSNDETSGESTSSSIDETSNGGETTNNSEISSDDETSIEGDTSSDEETSLEENTTSDKETTSGDNSSTTEKVTTTEKQTTTAKPTTKPTTEKQTKPVTQETTTTSSGSSGNNDYNELTKLVDSILAKCIKPSMTQAQKVIAIHDYLTYNVDYDYGNYTNGTIPSSSYTALGALKNGVAVCDGYAKAFLELATRAGLEATRVTGVAGGGGHAWNQVKVDGVWYNVDATWDDPTWTGKDKNDHSANCYTYCLVSDATLEKDHIPYSEKNACSKDFAGEALANAIIGGNTNIKGIYASNEAELKTKLVEYLKQGNTKFDVYMDARIDDAWEKFEEIIAIAKKPLKVTSVENFGSRLVRYEVTKSENVYVVNSINDWASLINNNKAKIEDMEIWYYDECFEDGYNVYNRIDSELIKAGFLFEINSSERPRYGKVVFSIKEIKNAIIIKDMSELKAYIQNHSTEEIAKYTFSYVGDLTIEDVMMAVDDAFIKSKGCAVESCSCFDVNGVVKLQILKVREVFYAENASKIVDFINENGIEKLLNKYITIYYGTNNTYDVVSNMVIEVSAKSGYYLCDSFSYYTNNGYAYFYFSSLQERAYVASNVEELKADIADAISKDSVYNSCFYYIDLTGKFSGEYDDIRALLDETGYDVTLLYSTKYGEKYCSMVIMMN